MPEFVNMYQSSELTFHDSVILLSFAQIYCHWDIIPRLIFQVHPFFDADRSAIIRQCAPKEPRIMHYATKTIVSVGKRELKVRMFQTCNRIVIFPTRFSKRMIFSTWYNNSSTLARLEPACLFCYCVKRKGCMLHCLIECQCIRKINKIRFILKNGTN